jgi:hypothetical protein
MSDDDTDTTNAAGEERALSEADQAALRRRGYTVDDDGVHVRHATGHEATPATIAAALVDEKSDDPPPAAGIRNKVLTAMGMPAVPVQPEPANSDVKPVSLTEVVVATQQNPVARPVDLTTNEGAQGWAGVSLMPPRMPGVPLAREVDVADDGTVTDLSAARDGSIGQRQWSAAQDPGWGES